MRPRLPATLVAIAALIGGCGGADRVIVGAGTTTVDSGLISGLEARFGSELSVVGGSTAELLELADQGAIDVAIVHDMDQEVAFMSTHPDAARAGAFRSRFLLVGPLELIDDLDGLDLEAAFATIAERRWRFVTRADQSGTHRRELMIWAAAGIIPDGDWYQATGQGMGFTLQVADQREAFTLAEEGAYLAATPTISLVAAGLAASGLDENPYSAIVVSSDGAAFFNWLTGPTGQAAVAEASIELYDRPVYTSADR